MVFGFGGGGGGSSAQASPAGGAALDAATMELDMMTDTFNRLVSSCHTKCISSRYHEADLNKGESVCVDRCVAKFFAVNQKVGEQMAALGAQQQQGGGGGGGSFF
ncbi:unnamed protein product [Jaminaea pallidilutea]